MAKLNWGNAPRDYFMGVSHGVMYLQNSDGTYGTGTAWNGLLSITETPTGGEVSKIYADDMQYGSFRAQEGLGGRIEAYSYPQDLIPCIGQREPIEGLNINLQSRRSFGMCYRTSINQDRYIIHLIYAINLNPGEHTYQTIGDGAEVTVHGFEFITIPTIYENSRPVSTVTIDPRKAERNTYGYIEDALYGSEIGDPHLPSYDEMIAFEIRPVLIRAFEKMRLWTWDSFAFASDTVPGAIHKEAERRIVFKTNSQVTYNRPGIVYSLVHDDANSPHPDKNHYIVEVIANPSEHSLLINGISAMQYTSQANNQSLTNGYVNRTYSTYYRVDSNAETVLGLTIQNGVTDSMMDQYTRNLGLVPSMCQSNISISGTRVTGTLFPIQFPRGEARHYLILKVNMTPGNGPWYSERDYVAWIECGVKNDPDNTRTACELSGGTGVVLIPVSSVSSKLYIEIVKKNVAPDVNGGYPKVTLARKEYSLSGLTLV